MSYNKTFEEQILQMQDERHRNEWWEGKRRVERGESIYVKFCVWCNAFNYGNGKKDAKLFAKFLKQENIELTFWQRKHLAEKYFGYKYEYDYEKKDWEVKKLSQNT